MSELEETECESCGYKGVKLKSYQLYGEQEPSLLCRVCASTRAGNAYQYPNQYPNGDVLMMLAWGINYLADVIGEQKE